MPLPPDDREGVDGDDAACDERRMSFRVRVGLVVVAIAAVAAVLLLTPAADLASPEALAAALEPVKQSPALPAYLLAAFVVAGALFLSVWLVIFQTCLLYGPVAAFPLALGGAVLSASVFYGVGRVMGQDAVRRFAPQRVQRAVEGAGLDAIIVVRLVPLLPFTFVNLCCGAFGVRFRVFLLGTVLGMAPGVLAMSILGERVLATLKDPSPESIAGLVVVVVALVGAAALIRRRAARRLHVSEPELESSGATRDTAASPSTEHA